MEMFSLEVGLRDCLRTDVMPRMVMVMLAMVTVVVVVLDLVVMEGHRRTEVLPRLMEESILIASLSCCSKAKWAMAGGRWRRERRRWRRERWWRGRRWWLGWSIRRRPGRGSWSRWRPGRWRRWRGLRRRPGGSGGSGTGVRSLEGGGAQAVLQVLVYWHTGTGVLVYWHTGTGALVYRHGALVHWCKGNHGHWCSNHWCTGVEYYRQGTGALLLQGVPLKLTPHKHSKSPALYEI